MYRLLSKGLFGHLFKHSSDQAIAIQGVVWTKVKTSVEDSYGSNILLLWILNHVWIKVVFGVFPSNDPYWMWLVRMSLLEKLFCSVWYALESID